ncbi:hypothetical protein [Natronoglycomyces albus]|uniref:Uncharacterized protein n=1 Tax=Natronoglycomyces albus TaxID=2811108 RepID=A0A895XTA1_9ACTN|nr:hypothetical protein [Natronoglycomyces albus]QSB05766.1 hypothetical protein JQS30_02210 [Natronoglycomyces albus]
MSESIEVSCEQLAQLAESLRQTADLTESTLSYLEDADPDWTMWGVPGALFASIYFPGTTIIRDMIGQLPESLTASADRIANEAEEIEANEADIARAFDQLGDATEVADSYQPPPG